MTVPRDRAGRSVLASPLWPAVVLAVVVVLTLLSGDHGGVQGQASIAPLLAAGLVSPRRTAEYGVLALAVVAVLGIGSHSYDAALLTSQIERLVIVALAGVAATLLAVARVRRENRLQSMTSIAEAAQQALLPAPPARIGDLGLAAAYLAAATDARIGGDFFDVRATPWGVRLLVGDVKGKGLDAVRMAGVVLGAFRERVDERSDLVTLLADLDRAVRRAAADAEDFVTAVVAEIDAGAGSIRMLLAGHPAPLLVHRGAGRLLETASPGLPLGLRFAGASEPALVEQPLAVGDRLLFYTDGTTEARSDDGSFFPLQERATAIMGVGTLDAAVAAMLGAVRAWSRAGLKDDAALLAVEIGAGATAGSAAETVPADLPARPAVRSQP